MTTTLLAESAFAKAPHMTAEKDMEAAALFRRGRTGNFYDRAILQEAFTTSDFAAYLSNAFSTDYMDTLKAYEPEWKAIADETKVNDFRPKKLRDIFGDESMDEVPEGTEYKGAPLSDLEFSVKVAKYGRTYGYTWEANVNGEFSELAQFPKRLANSGLKTEDRIVFEQIANATGWRTDFFGTVDNKPLTTDNLEAAMNTISARENHHGDLVDSGDLVLVVTSAMKSTAEKIVGAQEIETTGPDGKTKIRVTNPYKDLKVLVSRTLGKVYGDAATRKTAWALLPAPGSENPALVIAHLEGHEDTDLRQKADQGMGIARGPISADEGGFKDDTIWFRGRKVVGATSVFDYAVYASRGA